jgi:drug/metabolite transporter (DMT)-like permease
MTERTKRALLDIVSGALGAVLVLSLAGAIYAHLWLGQLDSTPASELSYLFAESVDEEKGNMELLRLFGAVGAVVCWSLLIALTPTYNRLVENTRRQTVIGLVGSLFIILLGSGMFVASGDLTGESIGLSTLVNGILILFAASLYLAIADPD